MARTTSPVRFFFEAMLDPELKELVELQNGTVNVASTPGKGSEFMVILPLAVAPGVENVTKMSKMFAKMCKLFAKH